MLVERPESPRMALVLARAPFLKRGASQQRSDAALSALRERQRWTSALGDGRYGGARGCTRAPQQGVALSNANVALRDLDYVNPRQPDKVSAGGSQFAVEPMLWT